MKTIKFFIILSILGIVILFTACSKEDTKEMPLEKVPVSNFVLKTTTSFNATTMLATAPTSGKEKYQLIYRTSTGVLSCGSVGGDCIPTPQPNTWIPPSNNWMQLMAILEAPSPEIGTFFYEHPHLLNMDSVDREMVIDLFRDNLIRIAPAYSNTPSPDSNEIQHFCIIERTASLEKDYSNVIYVLQYRYIP